ncbi:MAG: exodeoxyribonuclease VII small subunit [Burkholderiaceae bacterium]
MSPATSMPESATNPSHSFETAMTELESLVQQMENGNLPLDAMLQSYRRGAQLIADCKAKLEQIEHEINILDGEVLNVFDAQAVLSQPERQAGASS